MRSFFVTQARQSGLSDAEIAMLIGDKTGPAIVALTYGDAGDQLCEFSAPPAHIIPSVIAEIGRLTGSPEGTFPIEGTIDVAFSGHRLKWQVAMPSKDAECVLTPVP